MIWIIYRFIKHQQQVTQEFVHAFAIIQVVLIIIAIQIIVIQWQQLLHILRVQVKKIFGSLDLIIFIWFKINKKVILYVIQLQMLLLYHQLQHAVVQLKHVAMWVFVKYVKIKCLYFTLLS